MNALTAELARAIQQDRERVIREKIRFGPTRPPKTSRRPTGPRRRNQARRIRPAV